MVTLAVVQVTAAAAAPGPASPEAEGAARTRTKRTEEGPTPSGVSSALGSTVVICVAPVNAASALCSIV
jgi:hypothetical protein